jgi:flagellar biosynthesis anti-sigma factor FlgM
MDITKVGDNKINESQVSQSQNAQKNSQIQKVNVGTQTAAEAKKAEASKYLDKLELSGDASVAAEGLQAAKNTPDVRAEKVAALKAAIQSGTYKPDAKAVADSMIQKSFEESLLTRKA